jgi:uncharacterized protein YbjT (DUF2867 family)
MEEALRELQTPLTILRPAWFIDNAAWDVVARWLVRRRP